MLPCSFLSISYESFVLCPPYVIYGLCCMACVCIFLLCFFVVFPVLLCRSRSLHVWFSFTSYSCVFSSLLIVHWLVPPLSYRPTCVWLPLSVFSFSHSLCFIPPVFLLVFSCVFSPHFWLCSDTRCKFLIHLKTSDVNLCMWVLPLFLT